MSNPPDRQLRVRPAGRYNDIVEIERMIGRQEQWFETLAKKTKKRMTALNQARSLLFNIAKGEVQSIENRILGKIKKLEPDGHINRHVIKYRYAEVHGTIQTTGRVYRIMDDGSYGTASKKVTKQSRRDPFCKSYGRYRVLRMMEEDLDSRLGIVDQQFPKIDKCSCHGQAVEIRQKYPDLVD